MSNKCSFAIYSYVVWSQHRLFTYNSNVFLCTIIYFGVGMAEQLAAPTLDQRVLGSRPAGAEMLSKPYPYITPEQLAAPTLDQRFLGSRPAGAEMLSKP